MSNARTLASLIDGSNIKVPSGYGLDFGSTSDSTATGVTVGNEILSEYEIGTWTPTVSSVSVGSGDYTRIGDLVFIECLIDANSVSTYEIDGLPFSVAAASGYGGLYFGRIRGCDVLDSNGVPCRVGTAASTSRIEFRGNALNGADSTFTITTIASGVVRLAITGVTRVV